MKWKICFDDNNEWLPLTEVWKAEAVIRQCPNLSDQFDDYLNDTNSLSGDDILRILCEKQCEEQINSGKKNVDNS